MPSDEPRADGGVTQESIFGSGTGDERPGRSSPRKRFKRGASAYLTTPLRIAWSDWRTRIGGLGLLLYIGMGTFGVWFVDPPNLDGPQYLQPFQNMAYPLGTDNLGRGLFAQTIHSTPAMLKMALAGLTIAVGLAILVGVLSGYKGGTVDTALMTFADVFFVLPGLPMVIVLSAIFTPRDPFIVGGIIAITIWPQLAREIRSQVIALRSEDYVEASRALGLSTPTIVGQEVVPKIAPYILVRGSESAVRVIRDSVALYFLGILPFAVTNWGIMMNFAYGTGNAVSDPSHTYWLIVPLVALAGLGFALILFSQGLDRVFNPRLRARNASGATTEEG